MGLKRIPSLSCVRSNLAGTAAEVDIPGESEPGTLWIGEEPLIRHAVAPAVDPGLLDRPELPTDKIVFSQVGPRAEGLLELAGFRHDPLPRLVFAHIADQITPAAE